jgi:hypothetical protein
MNERGDVMATYTPRPGSKIEMIINHMKANADKPMDVVCTEMLEFVKTNMADVRSYYRWAVKNDIAPGVVTGGRGGGPRKTKEVSATKMLKDLGLKTIAQPPFLEVKPSKSPEEVARIKAANLQKMREISDKMKSKRVVDIADDNDTDVEERDSFSSPSYLTKDEVKALV